MPGTSLVRLLGTLSPLVLAAAALAQPAGYYDPVDTGSSATLRATLHDVIDDHTRFDYTSSDTDTWDILNLADEDPNDTGRIVDLYRNASYAKIPGGVGEYNREHSWPKSYGFPNDGSTNYPYTDCHHLFAADSGYNSSRSNKPFRDCDAACSEKTTELTDGRGGGSGVYPGNSNWTTGSFTQGTWETWGGRKGDVARAAFYMAIRYEGGFHGGTGVAEPDLELTDDEGLIAASNTGANEAVAYMGMLSTLLQWHFEDPVDSREIYRNEVVASFQGNRNPFIDHPEWVGCVWQNQCDFDAVPPAAPSGLAATAGNASAALGWLANGESDLAGYRVYRGTTSGGPWTLVDPFVAGTSYDDTGLTNGTTYYWVVTALDHSGNESAPSNEASATPDAGSDTTPPAPPTGLGAAPGDGQVSLDWSDSPEGDLDGYDVHRATVSGGPYTRINPSRLWSSFYVDSTVTNGTTYYYTVTASDLAGNESAPSAEASATPQAGAGGGGSLVLSEVLYDVSSGDDGFEWVELFNAGSTSIDLSGWSLGNGGTDYTTSLVQLSGVVAPGATFVVGGPTSSATNGNPTFDLVANFTPDFQNSGTAGDGVALFDVPAAAVTASTVPVDAVVYGPDNSSGLIDETGTANAPEVGDAPAGSSIERIDLAGAWQIQATPTPNATPLDSGPPPNTAPTVAISAPADGTGVVEGTAISFTASASDTEDGDLSATITWSSDLDGALGAGGSVAATLSVGTHTVTASVTDSGGLGGSDQVTVTVHPNTAPTVAISTPADGSSFVEGTAISFAAAASDAEDGDLTAQITWSSDLDGALGSGGSVAATLSVGTHTVTASVTDSGGLEGTDQVSVTVTASGPAPGNVLLSEVLYDVSGSDDQLEWVELYNAGSEPVDLAGWSLGSGGTDYTTTLVQLSGTIQPGATFVVGGPVSSGLNAAPVLDQPVDFSPDLQNSGTAGDGVALFNVPATSVTPSTVPVDAVVYGPDNASGLIDETGTANAPEVGDTAPDSSIERIDLAGAWQIQAAPTPNATPLGGASGGGSATFTSIAAEDGWVRESSESSLVGSKTEAGGSGASALRAGDDRRDRQYVAIVSFDTSSLPTGAVVTGATLRLQQGAITGESPFLTHVDAAVDVVSGSFSGDPALQASDFEAPATVSATALLGEPAGNGDWAEGVFDAAGRAAIDPDGRTQVRIRFLLGDDDDRSNDYVGFFSGDDSDPSRHPQLVLTWQ